jgi:threonylcarbamoyladenosine tRNA methylthiotransferase MtaB
VSPDAADTAPTVSVVTLGCKLNQADSEAIARGLAGEGVRVTGRAAPGAAAYVINTCSVTHVADRKARHAVRRARRLSPGAQVVLTGCYAETAPADIAEATGADLVLGNGKKAEIPARVLQRLRLDGDPSAGCPTPMGGARTRAFVRVQEGCSEMCAFCIVPYTRGREQTVPIDTVVREVQAREAEGYQEVVLTGTQLGNLGRDLGWTREEQGPTRLLARLLQSTSIPRIRLSSLQAQDIHPALLSLWQDERLCPHFHLPLQSGSDSVLQAMRRRYTAASFRRAAALIMEMVPGASITTDVIAGFPGETEADFEATARLCEKTGFAAMHCFPYSRRPHTGAALMAGHLPPQVRKDRLQRLLEISERSSLHFREGLTGTSAPVLWEERSSDYWQGLTPNYVRVYTPARDGRDSAIANTIVTTRLTGLHGDGLSGSLEAAQSDE